MTTDDTSQPTSPFATPTTAPANEAPTATANGNGSEGDTSFLDNLAAIEPLLKPCTVPGTIAALQLKAASNGNPFVSLSVQLYGNDMVLEDGTPVTPGKRLTSSVFASSGNPEFLRLTGAELKGLILALHDIPLNKEADAAYAALPATQKPKGPIRTPTGLVFDMTCLEPTAQWEGIKVMVQVRIKANKQTGERRNEFTILAASTPAAKGKSK